jgi:hypothetical protein
MALVWPWHKVRGALDGDPRGRVQQNEAILLVDKCKLDRRPLDEGLRLRKGKVRCLLHGVILG